MHAQEANGPYSYAVSLNPVCLKQLQYAVILTRHPLLQV